MTGYELLVRDLRHAKNCLYMSVKEHRKTLWGEKVKKIEDKLKKYYPEHFI